MNAQNWRRVRDQYYTYQQAIRGEMPDMMEDPIIAAAVTQIEMANLAIDARMAQLSKGDVEDLV